MSGDDPGKTDVEDDAVDDIRTQLEELEQTVDSPEERREVRRAIGLVDRLPVAGVRQRVSTYTWRDIAETFVGSILLALPLIVEDGVYDIADHFVAVPAFFALNVAFVIAMTAGLLYYTDFRDVTLHRPFFGIIPRRLAGVLVVSFVTATLTMTLWGRVGNWEDTWVAVSRISVVWAAGAFGGALGDILPGEARGQDISEELKELTDRLGIGDD